MISSFLPSLKMYRMYHTKCAFYPIIIGLVDFLYSFYVKKNSLCLDSFSLLWLLIYDIQFW